MISANNVTLRIGKKALFEDVNIKFTEGNCYGLIGANGAGKSTFLKILSGKLETTKGDIVITPGQRLSVLEQDHFKYDEFPVLDTVIMGNQRLYDIMKEKDAIYAKEDFTEADGIRASELEGEFAEMNGWEAESDAADRIGRIALIVTVVNRVQIGIAVYGNKLHLVCSLIDTADHDGIAVCAGFQRSLSGVHAKKCNILITVHLTQLIRRNAVILHHISHVQASAPKLHKF